MWKHTFAVRHTGRCSAKYINDNLTMVSVNDLSAINFALFMYQAAHDPFISLSGRGAYNRQSKHEKMYTYPFSFRVNFIIIVHMYIICLQSW